MFAPSLRIAVLLIIGALTATAQTPESPAVTRADLANAYLRLELALPAKKSELTDEQWREANRAFDAATLQFFGRRYAEALSTIDGITAELQPNLSDAGRAALSLRASIRPAVTWPGNDAATKLILDSLYPVAGGPQVLEGVVQLVANDGEIAAQFPFSVSASDGGYARAETIISVPDDLPVGRYRLQILADSDYPVISNVHVRASEPLDAVSARNAESLNALTGDNPALADAIAAVKARNALLTDNPDPENTAQLVLDLARIADEVAAEVESLESGVDPFHERKGDYWRVIPAAGKDLAVRVYVPDTLDLTQPAPLVLAFHGAGGDENMFFEAYGAGVIRTLADAHGCIVVAPLTYDFGGNNMAPRFDTLMAALKRNYTIDESRVYAVGHSMGGGAVARLVNDRPDRIAAAVGICGFQPLNAESIPPTLLIAGETDPVVPAARLEPMATAARDAGLDVTYRLTPGFGHTLIVGFALREAFDWFF